MIWAGAASFVLIAALATFLFTRRRFSTGNVLLGAVLSTLVLAPIALVGGALSCVPNAAPGTYLVVLPFTIGYVFWLDLTFGVSARLTRFGPRDGRAAPRPDRGART